MKGGSIMNRKKTAGKVILMVLFLSILFPAEMNEKPMSTSISMNLTQGKTSNFFDSPLYQVNIKEKLIAFTFDDGPHPVYTRKVLKVLDKYQAKGTFL
jgi:peptidoglycan/xylan/chitin deacetylase (PgdA/CDA1 family)